MDYMTLLKSGKPEVECYASPDKLYVCGWAYPWRCKDGWCLAAPKERRKAD